MKNCHSYDVNKNYQQSQASTEIIRRIEYLQCFRTLLNQSDCRRRYHRGITPAPSRSLAVSRFRANPAHSTTHPLRIPAEPPDARGWARTALDQQSKSLCLLCSPECIPELRKAMKSVVLDSPKR